MPPGRFSPGGPAPAVRMSPAWAAAIVAAALLYMWLYTAVPKNVRLAGAACAVAVPAVLLMRPRAAGLLYAAPLVFGLGNSDFTLGPFHPTAATLFSAAVTILWLLEKIVWDEPFHVPRRTGLGIAAAALAVQAMSIAVSVQVVGQHFWNAVREGTSLFLFMPVALVAVDQARTHGQAMNLARSIVLSLLVLAVAGIVQYLGISGFSRVDVEIGYVYRGRIESTFPGANVFAGFLELTVPLALGMLIHEKSRGWKAASFAAFAAGFTATLFTFSRGGFLMTVLGSMLVLVTRFRNRPALPALFAAAVVYIMASNAGTFARQLSLVTAPSDVVSQPTLVHRYITYRSFWNTFLAHPWTGVGWGALGFFTGRTEIYTFWDIRHTISTVDIPYFGGGNSLFLNQAVKGGILSIASLILLCLAVLRAIASSAGRTRGLPEIAAACALVGFAGHQLVDHLLRWPQINAFFWLLVGTMIALAYTRADADAGGGPAPGAGGVPAEMPRGA